jgi:hypothetical protein
MKNLIAVMLLSLAGMIGAGAYACGTTSLTVNNQSSYPIKEFHISPVGKATWGPNQLTSPLASKSTLTLTGIACDTYDIRLVDNSDNECILANVALCLANSQWTVDDAALASCGNFGK